MYRVAKDKTVSKEILLEIMNGLDSLTDAVIYLYGVSGWLTVARFHAAIKFYQLKEEFQLFKIKDKISRGHIVDISSVLVRDSRLCPASLRRLLRESKLLEYECQHCGVCQDYNGKKLVLQVDHIDGDNRNNELINLRYLCPNCHSQTSTFCRGLKIISYGKKVCSKCGINDCKVIAELCRNCYIKGKGKSKIHLLSKQDMELLVKNYSLVEICDIFSCCYDSLDPLLLSLEIERFPAGYWASKRATVPINYASVRGIFSKYNLEYDHIEKAEEFKLVSEKKAASIEARKVDHCIHGHEYTPENTLYAGKNKKKVCRICRDLRNAARPKDLWKKYNDVNRQEKKAKQRGERNSKQ